ncbi:MAG: hypothetical protein ACT4PT_11450 [Methanobacteriota archaeon]
MESGQRRIGRKAVSLAVVMVAAVGVAGIGQGLSMGCRQSENGDVTVDALPAGGEMTGWGPDCVNITSGERVTFRNLDALAHRPATSRNANQNLCFDLQNVNPGQSKNVRLTWKHSWDWIPNLTTNETGDGVYVSNQSVEARVGTASAVVCSETQAAPREGRTPCTNIGQCDIANSTRPYIEYGNLTAKLFFLCGIHGATMNGTMNIAHAAVPAMPTEPPEDSP